MTDQSPHIRSIKTDLVRLSCFLLFTAFYYALPWARMAAPSAGLLFLIVYSLLLPGLSLRIILFPSRGRIPEATAIALFLGLAWILCVAFLWGANGGALDQLRTWLPAFLAPAVLFPLIFRKRPVRAGNPVKRTFARTAADLALAGIVALVFLHVSVSGPPIDFTKDTLDHIGYIDEIRETGEFFPTGAVYADAGTNGSDLRKGVFHYLSAFYANYFDLGTMAFMKLFNAFLAALMMLGIYAATILCFGAPGTAVLAVCIFILGTGGGLATPLLREAMYTNRFGLIFYLLFVATAMLHLGQPRWRRIPALWLFAFAAGAVHILFGVFIGFAVLVTLVWKVCFPQHTWRNHFTRTLVAGITALAALAPYVAYRYLTSYQGTNAIHTEVQNVVFLTGNLFIADPLKIWNWITLSGAIAFLAIVPLWRARTESTALGYLIASSLTVPLVMFNPLLMPPLYRGLGYLITRFMHIAPLYILAAFFYAHLVSRKKTNPAGTGSVLLALMLSAALAVALVHPVRHGSLGRARMEAEKTRSCLLWERELELIREQIPDSSIVLSDPLTSYSIPAFTPLHVVSTLDQHAPPNDLELAGRVEQSRDVLNPYVPLSRTIELLAASRAGYVIVNGRIPAGIPLHFFSIEPELVPQIRKKFLSRPDLFEPVINEDDFLVVRWNGKETASRTVAATPPFFQTLPANFKKTYAEAGAATLVAHRIREKTVRRGETLIVELFWSSNRALSLGNYTVTIRFDKMEQNLPYRGQPFPKLSRKIMERMQGERYRFRADHKLAGGFLSPDTWPLERFVLDSSQLRIPKDLAPGKYSVSAILLSLPNQATYRLRDFFFDDDMFQGQKIAEIVIE